jgi:hypothetical protein
MIAAPGPSVVTPTVRDVEGSAAPADDEVVALSAAVDGLLAVPWWRRGGAGVREAVLARQAQAARLEAARLRLLAEADARGVGAREGAPSTAAWLAAETRMRPERAGQRVALARALGQELVATGSALAEGELSADHVGVMARTMSRLDPRVEGSSAEPRWSGTRRIGATPPYHHHRGLLRWSVWSRAGARVPERPEAGAALRPGCPLLTYALGATVGSSAW